MWLVGVVIRRYIDILIIIINFPTPLVLGFFLAAASLLLCSFLNVFSVFIYRDQTDLHTIQYVGIIYIGTKLTYTPYST